MTGYSSNPLVIKGYQQSLTIDALEQHEVIARMPTSEQHDSLAIQAAMNAYTSTLRQSAKIQIFLPAQ